MGNPLPDMVHQSRVAELGGPVLAAGPVIPGPSVLSPPLGAPGQRPEPHGSPAGEQGIDIPGEPGVRVPAAIEGGHLLGSEDGALGDAIEHAPEVFAMAGHISSDDLRRGDTSMAVGLDLIKSGEADAFVTMGNTGAAWLTALFRLGRIRGVDKPAIAPIFPTATGSCVVLDIGANPDCDPNNLLQFAIMGSVYAERARGIKNPKVGLISNGEEEGKGNELVRNALPLIKNSGLNFYGNVEGKEVIGGRVDVAVTDGFTGNVMLKSSEAVGKLIVDNIRDTTRNGSLLTKLDFSMVFDAAFGPFVDRAAKDPHSLTSLPLRHGNRVFARLRMPVTVISMGQSQAAARPAS